MPVTTRLMARLMALPLALLSLSLQAQTIPVVPLQHAPSLDGQDLEWQGDPGTLVKLKPLMEPSNVEAREVLVKAGRYQDEVIFYLEWVDSEEDMMHKPYAWSEAKQRYVPGPGREDRLAMQFAIKGDYQANWLEAGDFEADMWHWKSMRSNPKGLAHDKKTTLSRNKLLKAYRGTRPDGSPFYVLREDDEGSPIYGTQRYGQKEQEIMPKYFLHDNPSGSIADIQAKGVWSNGRWHLELKRRLNTGHSDDAVFEPGKATKGSVAIFDGSENEDHVISETLVFQF